MAEIHDPNVTPPDEEQPAAQKKSVSTDDAKKLIASSGSAFTGATPKVNDAGHSSGMTPGLRALDAGRGSRGYMVQANPPKGGKR